MNHWPEYIDIQHGASLGPGDPNLCKRSPWGQNGHTLRGHSFISVYIGKPF